MRGVPGSDLNSERGSEGATYVVGGVQDGEGDVVEKPCVDGLSKDRLPEGNLEAGELSIGEDFLAAVCHSLCVLKGQRSRYDANP